MNSEINVAFICDEGYALCTGVAVSTLKRFRDTERDYRVYLFADGVSEEYLARFRSMETKGFSIRILDVKDLSDHDEFETKGFVRHVSKAALYKFDLPQALPDCDRVLYLDGDILIRDSLTELYDMELGDCYGAVCQDIGAETSPAPFNQRLHIRHKHYFNSGVMLLNLDAMRRDNMTQKLLDYRMNGHNDYMDQDAFNVVFAQNAKVYSYLYNMTLSGWYAYPTTALNHYYGLEMKDKVEYYTKAKILHFSSPQKPWKYNDVFGEEDWLCACLASPFAWLMPERTPFENQNYRQEQAAQMDMYGLPGGWPLQWNFKAPPLVSVVVPVYNAQQYLGRCIESLLWQSLPNAEFIFVDDGSADDSARILEMYARMDNRVKVYRQENAGAGVARNNGIAQATGKYLTFVDSDDEMRRDALEVFCRRAESIGADMVISSANQVTEAGETDRRAPWCLKMDNCPVSRVFSAADCPKTLFQITKGAPWGKMYLRSLIAENHIEFPPLPRSEDMVFVYRAMALAAHIATVDEPLIQYHIIEGSGSLEDAKDRYPTAVTKAYCILDTLLKQDGKAELLRPTFLVAAAESFTYNLNTMKSRAGFEAMAQAFRTVAPQLAGPEEWKEIFGSEEQPRYTVLKAVMEQKSADAEIFASHRAQTIAELKTQLVQSGDLLSNTKKALAWNMGNRDQWKATAMSRKEQLDKLRVELAEQKRQNSELQKQLARQKEQTVQFQKQSAERYKELHSLHCSGSYRIGRAMTWLPRKLKKLLRKILGR